MSDINANNVTTTDNDTIQLPIPFEQSNTELMASNETSITDPDDTYDSDVIDVPYYDGRSLNDIIVSSIDDYLNSFSDCNYPDRGEYVIPGLRDVERDILNLTNHAIRVENLSRKENRVMKIKELMVLTAYQIARVIMYLRTFRRVFTINSPSAKSSKSQLLLVYNSYGPNAGIFTDPIDEINIIARELNPSITQREIDNDVVPTINNAAPIVYPTADPDLICLNNGIFNFDSKELHTFDPDYVFMSKSHVDYNAGARNVKIHNDKDGTDWDAESWMNTLSDDPEIVQLLWELISAVLRPHVRWNKSAWFYSDQGNNGKGTLCSLMRSLVGAESCASISLSDFGKEFGLEPLIGASAIVVDENEADTEIDKIASLKAVITGDVVNVNRKNKPIIGYQFHGMVIQCLNGFPKFTAASNNDAFYRRQLFIPFDKCFTGKERKYIKDDYLKRPEVLEYFMFRAMHCNVYKLSEPDSCRILLDEYKAYTDPVREFYDEMEERFVWDLLPFPFLYSLFKNWMRANRPSDNVMSGIKFRKQIIKIANAGEIWYCENETNNHRVGRKMENIEYLIGEYNVHDWQDPNYTGADPAKICQPELKEFYRGLLRRKQKQEKET